MTARVGWWVAVVFVLGCSSKSNPEFCDEATACPGDDLVCDLAIHECIADPMVAACEDDDPTDCPNGEPFCTDGRCSGCTSALGCDGTTPICEISVGECRGCTDSQDCIEQLSLPVCAEDGRCVTCTAEAGCDGTTPICDDGTCRACTSDAECDVLCDEPTGRCVDPDEVLFFDPTGTDEAICTRADPCSYLSVLPIRIVPQTRWVVFAPGIYPPYAATIELDHAVTFEAEGATFGPLTLAAGELSIEGGTVRPTLTCGNTTTRGNLTLTDVTVRGTVDLVNCVAEADRIDIDAGDAGAAAKALDVAPPSTLVLRTSTVRHGSIGANVYGQLEATDSVFTGATDTGMKVVGRALLAACRIEQNYLGLLLGEVTAIPPYLKLDRSIVSGNSYLGMKLANGEYDVTSSFIVENGDGTRPGALTIAGGMTGTIRFVTIAGNGHQVEGCGRTDTTCTVWPQISCLGNQAIDDSIVSLVGSNRIGSGPPSGCTGSNSGANLCTPAYVDADPITPTVDYHLGAATTCRGTGMGTPPATDYDGEVRPRGVGTEIGADEIE